MYKPYNFDLIHRGLQIVRSVHAAMPIGAKNIAAGPNRPSSTERTGNWAATMVSALRKGSLQWKSHTENNKTSWYSIDSGLRQYELAGTNSADYAQNIRVLVEMALDATMFKAGNCDEMSGLGLVHCCQWLASVPDDIDIPPFSIKMVCGDKPVIDHVFLMITMGDKRILCDPWLKSVFEINDHNLKAWRLSFENTEILSMKKSAIRKDMQNLMWDEFMGFIQRNEVDHYAKVSISSREMVKAIASLYERSCHEAVLSHYNEELFDAVNMPSSLVWHEEFISYYLLKYAQKASLNFYERKSQQAITAYIRQYEFPDEIPEDEWLEHIHLYIYLFGNNDFRPKASSVYIVNLLRQTSFEHLCRVCDVHQYSIEALQLYAAQVLADNDTNKKDERMIALRKALLLDDPLVAICDALKMPSTVMTAFWSVEDPWDDMPDVLKMSVKKALQNAPQNK